jgi:hypothetical protein
MTDSIEYLILEHLKSLRQGQNIIEADLKDIKARLLAMETHQAASHIDSARQSARLDDLDSRLNRVENRLNLAE